MVERAAVHPRSQWLEIEPVKTFNQNEPLTVFGTHISRVSAFAFRIVTPRGASAQWDAFGRLSYSLRDLMVVRLHEPVCLA